MDCPGSSRNGRTIRDLSSEEAHSRYEPPCRRGSGRRRFVSRSVELRKKQRWTAVVDDRWTQWDFPDAARSRAGREKQKHYSQRQAAQFGAHIPRARTLLNVVAGFSPRSKKERGLKPATTLGSVADESANLIDVLVRDCVAAAGPA